MAENGGHAAEPSLRDVDVAFDVRTDTPEGKDPDSHSATLREYHRLLWGRPLPDGSPFEFSTARRGSYLYHSSVLGEFHLGSDSIITSHRGRMGKLWDQVQPEVNEHFLRIGYTIGGSIVFPGNRIGTKQTINQRRGTHPRISDRFDLTLEAVRRHYVGGDSPLAETLDLYSDFFTLFGDFDGYVHHFFLHDLVDASGTVRFFRPFDSYDEPALPDALDDYLVYRQRQLDFTDARNRRIARYLATAAADS